MIPLFFMSNTKAQNSSDSGCFDFNNPSTTASTGTPCNGIYVPNLLDNWGARNIEGMQYRNTGSQGGSSDYYLYLDDLSCGRGSTVAFNTNDFSGNWIKKVPNEEGCFCFDLKLFGVTGTNLNGFNSIKLFNGTTPSNSTISASFKLTTAIDTSRGWVRICAPVVLSQGEDLPSNSDGQWIVNTGLASDWNTLIQNVGGIAFDVDGGNSGDEKWGLDNICISEKCDANVGGDQPTDEGSFCCDESENLVENGNFEYGNINFLSQYSQNENTLPGQYNVTDNAANFGSTVTDHSFCVDPENYSSNDKYLLVNGLTNQPSGSSAIIYSQNLSLKPEKEYRLCVNFKNMTQCTFDVLPEVQIEMNGRIVVPYTKIDADPTNPCDWVLLSGCFSGDYESQIKIRLKQDGLGDGNDLAIDDISIQELLDPNYNLTVTHNGSNNDITATINPFPFSNEMCELESNHYWFVYETANPMGDLLLSILPGTFAWSDNSGSYGNVSSNASWATPTTNFPTYMGFENNKFYVIGMYVPSCCESCFTEDWTYQTTYNFANRTNINFELTDKMKEEIKARFNKRKKSIKKEKNRTVLKITPNPTSSSALISLEEGNIQSLKIIDINGNTLKNIDYKSAINNTVNLNVSDLLKGIYVVHLKTQEGLEIVDRLIVK